MTNSDAEEASEDRRKCKFKKVTEDLRKYEGPGTQLTTIYIFEDKQISDVVEHVTTEHSGASNIRPKQTRTNVQDALTSIEDRLRHYGSFPSDDGTVMPSDTVGASNGQAAMVTKVLEGPPEPIRSLRYRCDLDFPTGSFEDMLMDKGLLGLIVLDRRETNVGWLKDKRVEPVKSASSPVPGKQ